MSWRKWKMCERKGHKCLSARATAQPHSLALAILLLLVKQPKRKMQKTRIRTWFLWWTRFSTIFFFKSEYKSCQVHQILLCMASAYLQKTQQPTEHASARSPKYGSKPNNIFFCFFLYNSQATQFGTNISQRLCTY